MSHPNKSAADRGRTAKLERLASAKADGVAVDVSAPEGTPASKKGRLARLQQAMGVPSKSRLDRKSRGGKVRKRADGGMIPGEDWSPDEVAPPAPPPVPAGSYPQELRAAQPTLRERISRRLMGDEVPSLPRQEFVKGLMGTTGLGDQSMGLVDATPASIPLGVDESLRAGDTQGAVLSMAPMGPAARGTRVTNPSRKLASIIARNHPPEHDTAYLNRQYHEVRENLKRGMPWDEATENASPAVQEALERIISPEQRAASNAWASPILPANEDTVSGALAFMKYEMGRDLDDYSGNYTFAILDALDHGWRPEGVRWVKGEPHLAQPGLGEKDHNSGPQLRGRVPAHLDTDESLLDNLDDYTNLPRLYLRSRD